MKSSVSLAVFAVVLLMELCTNAISQGLIGGPQDIDINEHEDAKKALQYAVSQYNIRSNDLYLRDVSEVLSAQRQVVEGLKYIFKVKMARTDCLKASVQEVCDIQKNPEEAWVYTCMFSVWSRPWLDSTIVNENCSPKNFTY